MRAFFNVVRDLARRGPREGYWAASALTRELATVRRTGTAGFRAQVRRDWLRFMSGAAQPVRGEIERRMHAAADWLLRAQDVAGDGGVSYGYFPGRSPHPGWQPSYPETTGYIMTSLIAYGKRFNRHGINSAVMRMAAWERDIQMSNGAVQGGQVCPSVAQTAAAFNTGMVLDGWCSVIEFSQDESIVAAAGRAADWLVADMDAQGYFRTNGTFVSRDTIKTYTCLCAWALYRFGNLVSDDRYRQAAIRSITAAIKQQAPNGWFASNCLTHPDAPLTHTIGYTLQGIIEVGSLANREDFIASAERSLREIALRVESDGRLAGRLTANWRPAALSSCLTGNAQIAICAFRMHEILGDVAMRTLGNSLLDFTKSAQELQSSDPGVNGAIAGSFPIFGSYMRGGYPNWATKYLLDALLLQDRAQYAMAPPDAAGTRRNGTAPY